MIRTRLLWFTIGFASASAAMGQFIFRDLWAERKSHYSQVKEKFSALEARVTNLEEVFHDNRNANAQSPLHKIVMRDSRIFTKVCLLAVNQFALIGKVAASTTGIFFLWNDDVVSAMILELHFFSAMDGSDAK